VVQAQLIALIEYVFCERLPFPRRVERLTRSSRRSAASTHGARAGDGDDDVATSANGGSGDDGSAPDNDDDLWEKAVRRPDIKFKKAMQRKVLTELKELLHTYLVARIVQVRVFLFMSARGACLLIWLQLKAYAVSVLVVPIGARVQPA
jgi:hypothetical protein